MANNIFHEPAPVSVILPVYNDEANVAKLMDSLMRLDYPRDSFEVIAVDNNSRDHSKEILKNYPVTVLEENELQSSYAARNKGIKFAKNRILAFVDSDCIVSPQWLTE